MDHGGVRPVEGDASGRPATEGSQIESEQRLQADPWGWWRRQMPIVAKWAYFDHAAVGPLSRRAADALVAFAAEASQEGDTVWPRWSARIVELRQQMARWLACQPEEICVVPNTSTGINLVAEGWPWQRGESVVVPEGEFPSNLFPWLNQRDRGVEVRIVPRRDGQVLVDDLIDAVDHSTRMIAVSWVGYASGFRVDLESLVERAHRRGVLVFLDAIQGLGVYPLDLQRVPVDFLAADGHKWLLGPEGAGIAMIRRQHQDRLRCTNVGWSSVKNSHAFSHASFDLRDDASRFESGSANLCGIAALLASVTMFSSVRETHGEHAIADRILTLTASLNEMLLAEGVETRWPRARSRQSGILTFSVPGIDPHRIRNEGLQRGVVLSCRGGGVRASIHAYNTEEDFRRLIETVRSVKQAGG
jgi:selenocysteine lyase/cysteine desulfurase